MKFTKYNSIENHTRTKIIDSIEQYGFNAEEWVLTLKVHGANYSYHADKNCVKKASRRGFIKDGENFYGDFNFDFSENVAKMRSDLNCDVLIVYGEIFGGHYNHKDVEPVKNAVRVQKGVSYCPFNSFVVFDIKIDGKYIEYDKVKEYCQKYGFHHVPELGRGKFEDLITYPTVFQDPLYKYFNLPAIEDNEAEGWVLKPVVPRFFPNGKRVIIKGKNPKFAEKSKRKKTKINQDPLSNDAQFILEELMSYLTENRLRNVLSHGDIPNITSKDFGKIVGLLSKDAFDDFMKDYEDKFNALDKKEQSKVKKMMNKGAGNVVRANFINIIDGMF